MEGTTRLSRGWTTLVRPVGTILPGAVAMMSTEPMQAHKSAMTQNTMIQAAMRRPAGFGGVSMTSMAAGRNSISSVCPVSMCDCGNERSQARIRCFSAVVITFFLPEDATVRHTGQLTVSVLHDASLWRLQGGRT